jgi:hypothetical protein
MYAANLEKIYAGQSSEEGEKLYIYFTIGQRKMLAEYRGSIYNKN